MEGIDWHTAIPAYGGLLLSLYNLWKNRSRVQIRLGCYGSDDLIIVSNGGPHPIEIQHLGAVEADGTFAELYVDPECGGFPLKVEPFSDRTVRIDSEVALYSAYQRLSYGRAGCFVVLSGGKIISSPGRLRRLWWWLLYFVEKQPQRNT